MYPILLNNKTKLPQAPLTGGLGFYPCTSVTYTRMQFSADISLSFDCEEVRLSVNQAIPCSLIINEVVTNIIKHGFTGRDKGIINTHLKQESDVVTITIKDNGVGLPENFDPESTKTLGMQLIKTLSQQLFGSYKFDSNKNGATFRLTFSKKAGQAPVL